MRPASLILAGIAALWLHSPAPLFASKILLLSSGDASNDAAIQSVLQSQGNSVTIGPTYNNFTGSGLSGYNAVFFNPTNMSENAPDMPASGQQALINYVNQGGGLVTGGGTSLLLTYPGDFRTLNAALPALAGQPDTGNSPVVFTTLTSDPVMNAGLSSTFSFPANGITEQYITPKANATAFFTTNQWTATFGGYGVAYGAVGWNYGTGRVLSLSTFSDNVALGNTAYDQMLTNAVNWASQSSRSTSSPFPPSQGVATPEPTSLAVFALASLGLLIASRRQRRPRG
jgi:hypothetical protein